ncbi:hypothetical protein B484DRAFT_339101 [Ochromonadaceae sp. CCMP2298]|nr:hypothetical protein B484DRAFT_339101 [Ochromonadaceae sp. CCMP2298]
MEQAAFPPSFQISRQLDQEKINFLAKRVDELINSNNELRTSSGQNEKDTHDIVLYFQREMEIKDDVILRLNEELIRTNSESTISTLAERLDSAESELKAVYAFKQAKDEHEGAIARLDKNLQNQREQLIDAMEEQERRFLEEKAVLFKELDEQKAAFREVALEEARSAMGEEAKKILADNNRMFEELKFHHNEAADNQAEKSVMLADLTLARRDMNIFAEKEVEYARQAHMRTKEIRALRERVELLERQQQENVERFKVRARELKQSVAKELQEATLDAAGLRRLVQIKNKELRNMKSLAATILSQRTETEQFFLEALHEVKEMIRKERQLSQAETRRALHKLSSGAGGGRSSVGSGVPEGGVSGRSTMFPVLNVKGANLHMIEPRKPSDLRLAEMPQVSIRELSWDDKELVLRVLFAKMNGVQGGVNRGVVRSAMSASHKRTEEGMPEPVFLSEGADLPPSARAAEYQSNFEMRQEGDFEEGDDEDSSAGRNSAGRGDDMSSVGSRSQM